MHHYLKLKIMEFKTIKDLQNGDIFSPVSNSKLFYRLSNKYAFTRPSKNPHLDYERYAVAVSCKNDKVRSFIHSTQIIHRKDCQY